MQYKIAFKDKTKEAKTIKGNYLYIDTRKKLALVNNVQVAPYDSIEYIEFYSRGYYNTMYL